MRLVSPTLKKVVYPAMHYCGWLKRSVPSDGCLVVNYHGVIPSGSYSRHPFLDDNLVSSAALQKQLRFLKANYDVIDAEAFRAWLVKGGNLPSRSVLVTCDDGLANNLSDMLPILQSESVSCLFFVTGESCREQAGVLWYEELYHLVATGQVSDQDLQTIFETDGLNSRQRGVQATWWSCVMGASRFKRSLRAEKIGLLRSISKSAVSTLSGKRWTLLNVRELLQLARSGMSIGAHTMSHPVLAQCTEDDALREIVESKAELECVLAQPVWALAYPFGTPGTITQREVNLARDAGFECAFVNVGGGAVDALQRYVLARTHVTSGMSLAEFEAHLSVFHTWLQAAVRR